MVESAEFTFFYVGEHIIHYQPSLFFKHRGMEKRFEGCEPDRAVVIAERVSGVGTVAHALAYCEAVERAAGCEVPIRARALRVLLAELERLYNHLHYLGHLCNTTTLKVGEAQGKLLEEKAKQLNGRLTGSRFLRSVLTPGGLRRDLAPEDVARRGAGGPSRGIRRLRRTPGGVGKPSRSSHHDGIAARSESRSTRERPDRSRGRQASTAIFVATIPTRTMRSSR